MALSDSESLMSASTRQIICSETAIGRPASMTRSTRHRASSRRFCSRSIASGIQPFLYLCDIFAHLFAHRVQLRVQRAAEPDPVLAPHVFHRQGHAQVSQLLFKLVDATGVAMMLFVAPLQQPLDPGRVDPHKRAESGGPSRDVSPLHCFSRCDGSAAVATAAQY